MRIFTLLLMMCLLTLCGYAYYDKQLKPKPVDTSFQELPPPPFTLGENDDFALTAQDEKLVERGLPIVLTVTDKTTGNTFSIPGYTGASLGGYIKNDTAQTTLFYSAGTSHVRMAHLIDLINKKESNYFCHTGEPTFWKTYFIYQDCTTSEKLQQVRGVIENGEYMPIIYKLDLQTGEKTELIKSDELHIYTLDRSRTYTDTDTDFIIHMTSVTKLSDWADLTKWKEGEKVIKMQ